MTNLRRNFRRWNRSQAKYDKAFRKYQFDKHNEKIHKLLDNLGVTLEELKSTSKGKHILKDLSMWVSYYDTKQSLDDQGKTTSSNVVTGQSPSELTTGQSPSELTTGQSPSELTTGQSPSELTTGQSPSELTTGQSPSELTSDDGTLIKQETIGPCEVKIKSLLGQWRKGSVTISTYTYQKDVDDGMGMRWKEITQRNFLQGKWYNLRSPVGIHSLPRLKHLGEIKKVVTWYEDSQDRSGCGQPLQYVLKSGKIITLCTDNPDVYNKLILGYSSYTAVKFMGTDPDVLHHPPTRKDLL